MLTVLNAGGSDVHEYSLDGQPTAAVVAAGVPAVPADDCPLTKCVMAADCAEGVRFKKRVSGALPSLELVISQVSRTDKEIVWRVQVEALRVSVRCTVAVDANTVPCPFYSPQLAKYMHSTYFARFPLWSSLSLGNRLQKSNSTAEAGVRVIKRDEAPLPHKPHLQLRLDQHLSARIAKRVAQSRLLLTQIKHNLARQRKQAADLDAKDTWSKARSLQLTPAQFNLYLRLRLVIKWRKTTHSPAGQNTLSTFCNEIASRRLGSEESLLSAPTLSKIANGKSWPSSVDIETAMAQWIAAQERIIIAHLSRMQQEQGLRLCELYLSRSMQLPLSQLRRRLPMSKWRLDLPVQLWHILDPNKQLLTTLVIHSPKQSR